MHALIALFAREGYARVEPPILQPADVFVDLSGEDIRRRMFVTQDAAGHELCLRPEYTIPVCLASPRRRGHRSPAPSRMLCRPGLPAAHGRARRVPAGRHRVDRPHGRHRRGRGDPRPRARGPRPSRPRRRRGCASATWGFSTPSSTRSASRRRRSAASCAPSCRARASPASPRRTPARAEHAGLLAAIEGQAPQAAKAFVEDILSIAGIARVGGRTAGEIAERFLARAANRSGLPRGGAPGARALPRHRGRPGRGRGRGPRGSPPMPGSTSGRRSTPSRSAPASWRRAGSTSAPSRSRPPSRATSTTTRASSSRCRIPAARTASRSSAAGATTACSSISARRTRSRRSAARFWLDRIGAP